MTILHLLTHLGTGPVHVPSGKHVLVRTPQRAYDDLQEWVTVAFRVVFSLLRNALAGTAGGPHSIAKVIETQNV